MNELSTPPLFRRIGFVLATVTLASMAGGMAWGIRGQYGHDTGAMIAGVLVGFALTTMLASHLSTIQSARAVALFALGIGIGGAMTYGQTVGLTHDGAFVNNENTSAFWWGMLGLAIKGGVWIGLGATLFGIGLSGKNYRPLEMLALFAVMIVVNLLGVWLLNRPFQIDPEQIPKIYFSHYEHWAEKTDRPRQECWGGFVFALITLLGYLLLWKKDRLAWKLGIWGIVGGAIGFPAGQSVQAMNAWHAEWISSLPTAAYTSRFNWWNMMETTFGLTFGAIVGLGLFLNRAKIQSKESPESSSFTLHPLAEAVLVAVHVSVIVIWTFSSGTLLDYLDHFVEPVLVLIILPVMATLAGKYWPFFMALPIVLVPIAGKTVRQLVVRPDSIQLPLEARINRFLTDGSELQLAFANTKFEFGWLLYLVAPLFIACVTAIYFANPKRSQTNDRYYSAWSLIVASWIFFCLNFAFFEYPWPWQEWTGRTANGLIFTICLMSLTLAAIWKLWANRRAASETGDTTS